MHYIIVRTVHQQESQNYNFLGSTHWGQCPYILYTYTCAHTCTHIYTKTHIETYTEKHIDTYMFTHALGHALNTHVYI